MWTLRIVDTVSVTSLQTEVWGVDTAYCGYGDCDVTADRGMGCGLWTLSPVDTVSVTSLQTEVWGVDTASCGYGECDVTADRGMGCGHCVLRIR